MIKTWYNPNDGMRHWMCSVCGEHKAYTASKTAWGYELGRQMRDGDDMAPWVHSASKEEAAYGILMGNPCYSKPEVIEAQNYTYAGTGANR